MRTEVSNMKAEYDEQANRLAAERGTVFSCVQEQENLTRQLHLLHDANRKLHDTNDDLRSALDVWITLSFWLFSSQLTFTCSKSTIETLEKGVKHWRRSAVFIVNFEHISHLCLVFSIVDFEQLNVSWEAVTCGVLVKNLLNFAKFFRKTPML